MAAPLTLPGLLLAIYNIPSNHEADALLVPLEMLVILVIPSMLVMVSSVDPTRVAGFFRATEAASAASERLRAYALPVVCFIYWGLCL